MKRLPCTNSQRVNSMEETVHMYRTDRTNRADIPKDYYEHLSNLIIGALTDQQEITLNDLLSLVEKQGPAINTELLHCYFLQVKMDLQAKGFIVIKFAPKRVQIIKLKRRKSRKELYDSMLD